MALFTNQNRNSTIASVEFSVLPEGNRAFFHLKEGADVGAAKQWLTQDLGQTIEAETQSGKYTVLVTRGEKGQEELADAMRAHGDSLAIPETKGKISLWTLRGWGSIIGQPLQFISGILQKGPPDIATIGFAVSNMTANLINVFFGAEKRTDANHLRFIKENVNTLLTPYVPEGTQFPDPSDKRAPMRKEPEAPKSIGQKLHGFLKAHSVVFGDILLRYIGAFSLAFAVTKPNEQGKQSYEHWKPGLEKLFKGKFKAAYEKLKTTDRATHWAGVAYIGGKALSLTSKVPDPYDTSKKHTGLDTFREKVVFPLSSVIEGSAAAIIALDRLNIVNYFKDVDAKTGKLKMRTLSVDNLIKGRLDKGKTAPEWLRKLSTNVEYSGRETPKWLKTATERDWLGGVGGLFFTAALIIRIFAPFAVREVNMDEVNAHAADSLAQVPPEKLPQAVAKTAAYLTDHFKDKKLEFGKVYSQLTDDLYRYHNIAMPGADGGTGPTIDASAATPTQEPVKTFAKPELRKPELASVSPAAFQDRVSPVAESIALGP